MVICHSGELATWGETAINSEADGIDGKFNDDLFTFP
jgi:hypothetical protein